MPQDLTVRPDNLPAQASEFTVEQMTAQVMKIQQLMKDLMKDGEHYGVIPGTGNKKTLLKPGAEKLCLMFRFAPHYTHDKTFKGNDLILESTCTLKHYPSDTVVATGSGMCSTLESKYAFRKGQRLCPNCGEPKIIVSKYPNKQTGVKDWYCLACKTNFEPEDPAITKQNVGRIANQDLADQYNTIIKMADKRALVAAVLNATAASDIFTQDLEDLEENARARGAEEGEKGDAEGKGSKGESNKAGRGKLKTKPDEGVELKGVEVCRARAHHNIAQIIDANTGETSLACIDCGAVPKTTGAKPATDGAARGDIEGDGAGDSGDAGSVEPGVEGNPSDTIGPTKIARLRELVDGTKAPIQLMMKQYAKGKRFESINGQMQTDITNKEYDKLIGVLENRKKLMEQGAR